MSAQEGLSQAGHFVNLVDQKTLPDEEKVLQTGSNFTPFDSFESFCNRVNVSAFLPKFKVENESMLKTLLPLFPLDHQIQCIQRTLERYQTYRSLANVTPTGLGKTFFAMIIAYILDLKLYVIGPSAAISAWNSQSDIFGVAGKYGRYVNVDDTVRIVDGVSVKDMTSKKSYQGASGNFYHSLNDKFLRTISDDSLPNNIVRVQGTDETATFEVMQSFKDLVDAGILVVFDEAHRIKNSKAKKTKCAMAIADYINFHPDTRNSRSRIMYMSATLIDTEKAAANMTRLLGVVPPTSGTDDLGYRKAGMMNWIVNNATIETSTPLYTSSFIDIFSTYIKPRFIDRMGKIEYPKYLQSYGSYLYLRTDRKTLINYVRTLDEIDRIVNIEEGGDKVKMRATKLTAINRSLEAFELGLAPEIAKFIVRTTQECPYAKFVVAFFHHNAIDKFNQTLKNLGYENSFILMRGRRQKSKEGKVSYTTLSPADRKYCIDQFTGPNNKVIVDSRGILRRQYIGFILQQTTAESISLHDVNGDGPTIFVSCFNYQYQKLVQAGGRVVRSGMLSPAFIFWAVPDMFLVKDIDPEYEDLSPVEKYHITSLNYKNVSDRLAKKSEIVRAITEVEEDSVDTTEEEEGDDIDDVGVSIHDAAVQFNEYKISRLVGLSEGETNYCRSAIIILRRNEMVQIFNQQKIMGIMFSQDVWNDFFNHFYGINMPDIRVEFPFDYDAKNYAIYQYQSYFFVRGLNQEIDYLNAMYWSQQFNGDKITEFMSEELEMSTTDAIL